MSAKVQTSAKHLEAAAHTVNAMMAIQKQFLATSEERGTIPCPKCGEELRYRCAKSKRTRVVLAGRCSTEGCLEFMT